MYRPFLTGAERYTYVGAVLSVWCGWSKDEIVEQTWYIWDIGASYWLVELYSAASLACKHCPLPNVMFIGFEANRASWTSPCCGISGKLRYEQIQMMMKRPIVQMRPNTGHPMHQSPSSQQQCCWTCLPHDLYLHVGVQREEKKSGQATSVLGMVA
jgi:hypothetical protein